MSDVAERKDDARQAHGEDRQERMRLPRTWRIAARSALTGVNKAALSVQ